MLHLIIATAPAATLGEVPHMNPRAEYLIANARLGHEKRGFGDNAKFFEVISPPIRSQYSQVVWKQLDPVALPPSIVTAFDGKVMAVTGHEVNVIRIDNETGAHTDVPCYESYNHHYGAHLSGKGVRIRYVDTSGMPLQNDHGHDIAFDVIPGTPHSAGFHAQSFSEHNGNEARQTYHGLPIGEGKVQYIVPLESPTTFTFGPMQINTRNPDGSGKRCSLASNCPLPKHHNSVPGAAWNGVIECPCTDRVEKEFGGHLTKADGETCGKAAVANASECFIAAAALLGRSAPAQKSSCAVPRTSTDQVGGVVAGNCPKSGWLNVSQAECCARCDLAADCELFIHGPSTQLCYLVKGATGVKTGVADRTYGAKNARPPPTIANATITSVSLPRGCFVERDVKRNNATVVKYNNAIDATGSCGASTGTPPMLVGDVNATVALALALDGVSRNVTITITAPDDDATWYGVGFNTSTMLGSYAIIIDGAGAVSERVLGYHVEGSLLAPSSRCPLTVVKQRSVAGKSRTTVLHRAIRCAGDAPRDGAFSLDVATLQIIAAVGSTSEFGQHVARSTAALSLIDARAPTCICRGGVGTINGFPFNPKCMGEPLSDLIKTNNPTCDINLYSGGMACCRGGVFLLDTEQVIPSHVDEVYFKWRFYYDDFKPETMKPTYHLEWQFGHIEYDVPKAPEGTPPEDAVHTLTTRFTGLDLLTMGNANAGGEGWDLSNTSRTFELIMAGFHCHTPGCLGGELFNADTGEELCHVKPVAGQSATVAQNESTYLWLPPCQWGAAVEGLAPPPTFSMSTNFLSVKRTNSSVGHFGVMAIWQGRGAYAD